MTIEIPKPTNPAQGVKLYTKEDLAQRFEQCATRAINFAAHEISPKKSAMAQAEAGAFMQMADMVRACEFVGWDAREKAN